MVTCLVVSKQIPDEPRSRFEPKKIITYTLTGKLPNPYFQRRIYVSSQGSKFTFNFYETGRLMIDNYSFLGFFQNHTLYGYLSKCADTYKLSGMFKQQLKLIQISQTKLIHKCKITTYRILRIYYKMSSIHYV